MSQVQPPQEINLAVFRELNPNSAVSLSVLVNSALKLLHRQKSLVLSEILVNLFSSFLLSFMRKFLVTVQKLVASYIHLSLFSQGESPDL